MKTKKKLTKEQKAARLERKRNNPKSAFWKKKALEIFMARGRNEPCAVCGSTGRITYHHIIPQGRCSVHVCNPINVIPLCDKHHMFDNDMAAHSQDFFVTERFMAWMNEHYPEKMAWARQHRRDMGAVNWKAVYEAMREGKA